MSIDNHRVDRALQLPIHYVFGWSRIILVPYPANTPFGVSFISRFQNPGKGVDVVVPSVGSTVTAPNTRGSASALAAPLCVMILRLDPNMLERLEAQLADRERIIERHLRLAWRNSLLPTTRTFPNPRATSNRWRFDEAYFDK